MSLHVTQAKVAVVSVILRLLPDHGSPKTKRLLCALCRLSFHTSKANFVRRLGLVLVPSLHIKVGIVTFPNKVGNISVVSLCHRLATNVTKVFQAGCTSSRSDPCVHSCTDYFGVADTKAWLRSYPELPVVSRSRSRLHRCCKTCSSLVFFFYLFFPFVVCCFVKYSKLSLTMAPGRPIEKREHKCVLAVVGG